MRQITPDDDKWSIRKNMWDYIEHNDLANFPRPVKNRIPNVKDADKAADQVLSLDVFKSARVVKINPDKPQEKARFNTLEAKKTLLVPTPRLRQGLFNKLNPPADANKELLHICSTSQGIKEYSKPVSLDDKVTIDLIVLGSVAVSKSGLRIGKGEGYADLEYAMMRCMKAVDDNTPIVTTVHDCQVFDELPEQLFGAHDVPVDYILTPTQVIECKSNRPKPKGVMWSLLTRERLRQVPILKALRKREEEAGVDVTLKDSQAASGSEDDVVHSGAEGDNLNRGGRRVKARRSKNLQQPLPGVFVGRFPSSLRASELKTQVREQGINPIRMVWRGGKRHAFLLFDSRDKAEEALSTLEGMAIDGKEVKVEMANERSLKGEGEEVEESGEAKRGQRGPLRQRRIKKEAARRRRQESTDGEDSTPTKGSGKERRRRNQQAGPGVWIGNLPRNIKVSIFKQLVRDHDVEPIRVVWRGRIGFSILQFQNQLEAEHALERLKDFSIEGRELRIEMSSSAPKPIPRSDGDQTEESDADRPAPRRQHRPRGAPRNRGNRSLKAPRPTGQESEEEDGRPLRRRLRRRPQADMAVLVGNVPKSVRISEFKAKVRENEVNPLRVIWRGNNGHAYLQFETDDGAVEAAKLLQGLSIQDSSLSVEVTQRSAAGKRVQENGEDHSE